MCMLLRSLRRTFHALALPAPLLAAAGSAASAAVCGGAVARPGRSASGSGSAGVFATRLSAPLCCPQRDLSLRPQGGGRSRDAMSVALSRPRTASLRSIGLGAFEFDT